jgi:hypothetical protein
MHSIKTPNPSHMSCIRHRPSRHDDIEALKLRCVKLSTVAAIGDNEKSLFVTEGILIKHTNRYILFLSFSIQLFRHIREATNEPTPWSRVLPENLTDLQLLKKFPTFYRTRMFTTAFTRARHLSLS